VLVEVKPRFTVRDLIAEAAEKIDRSGWRSGAPHDALILGATWKAEISDSEWTYFPPTGALRVDGWDWRVSEWLTCSLCHRPSSQSPDFQHERPCMVCGQEDTEAPFHWPPDIEAMWAEAGNAVQWQGGA
jgi:hypothetical protein